MNKEEREKIVAKVVKHIDFIRLPGYGFDEVQFLTETVCLTDPDFIFEWGTNRGSSARIFYQATKLASPKCRIYTFELPIELSSVTADHPGKAVGEFIRGYPRIRKREGDGIEVAIDICRMVEPLRPLFFVDGDHNEDKVEAELLRLFMEVPHATIVLHDTNHPAQPGPTGPAQALRRLSHILGKYTVVELRSQAGMVRLTPK